MRCYLVRTKPTQDPYRDLRDAYTRPCTRPARTDLVRSVPQGDPCGIDHLMVAQPVVSHTTERREHIECSESACTDQEPHRTENRKPDEHHRGII